MCSELFLFLQRSSPTFVPLFLLGTFAPAPTPAFLPLPEVGPLPGLPHLDLLSLPPHSVLPAWPAWCPPPSHWTRGPSPWPAWTLPRSVLPRRALEEPQLPFLRVRGSLAVWGRWSPRGAPPPHRGEAGISCLLPASLLPCSHRKGGGGASPASCRGVPRAGGGVGRGVLAGPHAAVEFWRAEMSLPSLQGTSGHLFLSGGSGFCL